MLIARHAQIKLVMGCYICRSDVSLSVDIYTEDSPDGSSGVYIGARVDKGGCHIMYSNGLYLWIYPHKSLQVLTGNFCKCFTVKSFYEIKDNCIL